MRHASAFNCWIGRLEALATQPRRPASETRLRRAAMLLDRIGNPHREYRAIHVTGSSGKGSTTAMAGCILQAASFRTGLLRSPHLVSYTERIAVDGRDIAQEDWVRHFETVWPAVEAMSDGTLPNYDLGRPSFSEVLFAVASLHFRESGVQWAALEAGMGGRLDATNLVNSDVAVVTNVSLEHTQVLGDSITKIATEKAAIIKPGCSAVTASHHPDALAVIRRRATSVGAPLVTVPHDVSARAREQSTSESHWSVLAGDATYDVELGVLGTFQGTNAATAVAAALALRSRGITVPDRSIISGLEDTRVPGRLEFVSRHPPVLLDGAHNPDAAEKLVLALEELLPDERIVFLFGALVDKDVGAMAATMSRVASVVFVTRAPGTPRAATPANLAQCFVRNGCTTRVVEDADTALGSALEEARRGGTLVVCGSLYLVGRVREIMAMMNVAL